MRRLTGDAVCDGADLKARGVVSGHNVDGPLAEHNEGRVVAEQRGDAATLCRQREEAGSVKLLDEARCAVEQALAVHDPTVEEQAVLKQGAEPGLWCRERSSRDDGGCCTESSRPHTVDEQFVHVVAHVVDEVERGVTDAGVVVAEVRRPVQSARYGALWPERNVQSYSVAESLSIGR